jgi:hypothetical protein
LSPIRRRPVLPVKTASILPHETVEQSGFSLHQAHDDQSVDGIAEIPVHVKGDKLSIESQIVFDSTGLVDGQDEPPKNGLSNYNGKLGVMADQPPDIRLVDPMHTTTPGRPQTARRGDFA